MDQKKILFVDDDFPMRYLVEHQLQRKGFEVILAKDGPGGLQAAQEQKPDLVVLDLMMPGMDGFEVCRKIRRDPLLARVPIIFLTSSVTKEDKSRAFELGADDYLTKPFHADEFLAHVMAVLRRTGALGQEKEMPGGRIAAFYSPKGGVGTTTLAIQLSETMVMHEGRSIVLIDLDLPLGGIAPMLSLYTERNVVSLLKYPPEHLSLSFIQSFAQRHRSSLLVVPAPGEFIQPQQWPKPDRLKLLLQTVVSAGYDVVLDLGSTLTDFTVAAMRQTNAVFVLTSGQEVANKLTNQFIDSAPELQLDHGRLMPVINELHGPVAKIKLARVPVARIPHANERSRSRLWLREQGMRKLVSVMT